jgi:hypothetical protein
LTLKQQLSQFQRFALSLSMPRMVLAVSTPARKGQGHHHHHQDCDPSLARVQRGLAQLNYYRGAIDGIYRREFRAGILRLPTQGSSFMARRLKSLAGNFIPFISKISRKETPRLGRGRYGEL